MRDFVNEDELLRDFVAPGSPATPAPAKELTPDELMATPDHMLAWLRGLPPTVTVTESIHDPNACLGCSFMAASGHPEVTFGGSFFGPRHSQKWSLPPWFLFVGGGALGNLVKSRQEYGVTAAQAIAAIEKVAGHAGHPAGPQARSTS